MTTLEEAESLRVKGWQREDAGDLRAALVCYERAASWAPDSFEIAIDIGVAAAKLRQFDRAERAYRRAIELRPQSPIAWSNFATLLTAMRRDDDAIACCRHALELDPRYDKARFNLSYVLLRRGQLAEGLLCLEARAEQPKLAERLNSPRWAGDRLDGRSLLVVSDAGHGDMIQMARYADALRERGAGRIVLHCPPALKSLMAKGMVGQGFDQVVGYDELLYRTDWDVWTLSSSLPYFCDSTLGNLPDRLPYIAPCPERAAFWRSALRPAAEARERLVGVVWRGNPRHENDADRSLPSVASLAALSMASNIRFIDLQFGAVDPASNEAGLPFRLEPVAGGLGDFYETAAVVQALDLIISVDTSMVHLAGALGKPVWVLLSDYMTDWRWFTDRDDSPWYPGAVRLFRQPRAGAWQPVIDEVVQALSQWS